MKSNLEILTKLEKIAAQTCTCVESKWGWSSCNACLATFILRDFNRDGDDLINDIEKMDQLSEEMKAHHLDLLMIESPSNHYPTPEGHFGARNTNGQRYFFRLNEDGSYPHPDEIQRRLDAGEYLTESDQ